MPHRFGEMVCAILCMSYLGCGGGGSGGGGDDNSPPPDFSVSGTALYEKKVIDPGTATLTTDLTNAPIPYASIQVINTQSGLIVSSGTTDAGGTFDIAVPGAETGSTLRVRVRTQSAVSYASTRVVNLMSSPYNVFSATFTGPQSGLSLVASASDAGGRIGGAFNIYAQAMRAITFIRSFDPAAEFPPVDLSWVVGQTPNPPCTCFTHVHPGGQISYLIGVNDPPGDPDDYDDSVIIHEFGHYVAAAFSHDSSPGGLHLICTASPPQNLDYRLSFSEGWANAFAQMVLGDRTYVDTMDGGGFTFDMESPCLNVTGPGSEDAIGGAFWDLFDGPASSVASSDADTLDVGFGPLWETMKGLRPTMHVYVGNFLTELKNRSSVTDGDWNAHFTSFGLGTPIAAFPGTTLTFGNSTSGTVDATLGQETLFAANAYYGVQVATAGTLTITLTISNAANDLDLYLWEDPNHQVPGEELRSSTGTDATETITVAVSPGTYLVQVQAFDGANSSAGFTIQADFTASP
ncbi:MAG: pre-peptidase C-terminal domain-containing protein [Planctomycetes bacterium]|nr:pre-peptidase C-terminal domain-containing protein [Planctomycetota bacterium]